MLSDLITGAQFAQTKGWSFELENGQMDVYPPLPYPYNDLEADAAILRPLNWDFDYGYTRWIYRAVRIVV